MGRQTLQERRACLVEPREMHGRTGRSQLGHHAIDHGGVSTLKTATDTRLASGTQDSSPALIGLLCCALRVLGRVASSRAGRALSPCAMAVLVKHIMTSTMVTFFPEQSLALADEVMRIHGFRHLPVVDADQRLVGMVSDRDILAAKVSTVRNVADSTRELLESTIMIRDIMTVELWSVRPDSRASAAGTMLIDHRFSCLPVIDEDGKLVGLVTEGDFLRCAIRMLAMHDHELVDTPLA